jgi:serine/threonine protein kinase
MTHAEQLLQASEDLDPALVDLVDELSRRAQQGVSLDFDTILREHPEHADRLRPLLPAICGLADLFRSDSGERGAAETNGIAGGTVVGEYLIVRRIGQGGMGVVYEAVQTTLGRRVALKVLPQAWATPSLRKRFEREAQAAANLHHTNIVPVFGVAEHQGMLVYAMQFIAGKSLDRVIAERVRTRAGMPADDNSQGTTDIESPRRRATDSTVGDANPHASTHGSGLSLTPGPGDDRGRYFRSVARVGVQAAEALAFAHRQGVLHRDVKPANLLLDDQGVVWLTDFGLAQVEGAEDLTHTGTLVGTLRYLAPERLAGHADPRSDVYSLGATLYELATLRPAYPEADRVRLLRQIENASPPPPRAVDSEVPRDLETIIRKAMDREPARRYVTAGDLAEDLLRFVEDRPILARPLRLHERLWRWCRRKPLLASLTGAVVAATVVTIATLAVAVVMIDGALRDTNKAKIDADTQRGLADQRANDNARLAQQEKELRLKIQRDAAGLLFDKAYARCEQGDAAIGLLLLVRSLEAAEEAGDSEVAKSARLHLNA